MRRSLMQIARLRVWLCRAGMLLIASLAAFAEGGNSVAHSYTLRAWTAADGLPLGAIQALAQSHDRYLWIGTDGGLVRFDGSTFQSVSALPQKSIFALLAARDGSLWIGTEGAGVYRVQRGSVQGYGAAQGLTNAFIRTIVQDATGVLWVGTDDGLFRVTGGRFERVDNTAAFPSMTVHAILAARDGSLWIGGSRLVRWKHGVAAEWPWRGNAAQTAIKSMLEDADGSLELGCANGLYRITAADRAAHRPAVKVAGVDDTVRALHQCAGGPLWVATSRHGVRAYEHGAFAPLPA